jgi:hypothetical protein
MTKHMSLKNDQQGIIHHLGLFLFALLVTGVIGFGGYRVYRTSISAKAETGSFPSGSSPVLGKPNLLVSNVPPACSDKYYSLKPSIGSGGLYSGPSSGGGNTYESMRAGADDRSADLLKNGSTNFSVGQGYQPAGSENEEFYQGYATYLEFDTTALAGQVVEGAHLVMDVQSNYTKEPGSVEIYEHDFGTLDTNDWINGSLGSLPVATMQYSSMRGGATYIEGDDFGTRLVESIKTGGMSRYYISTSSLRLGNILRADEQIVFSPINTRLVVTTTCILQADRGVYVTNTNDKYKRTGITRFTGALTSNFSSVNLNHMLPYQLSTNTGANLFMIYEDLGNNKYGYSLNKYDPGSNRISTILTAQKISALANIDSTESFYLNFCSGASAYALIIYSYRFVNNQYTSKSQLYVGSVSNPTQIVKRTSDYAAISDLSCTQDAVYFIAQTANGGPIGLYKEMLISAPKGGPIKDVTFPEIAQELWFVKSCGGQFNTDTNLVYLTQATVNPDYPGKERKIVVIDTVKKTVRYIPYDIPNATNRAAYIASCAITPDSKKVVLTTWGDMFLGQTTGKTVLYNLADGKKSTALKFPDGLSVEGWMGNGYAY